MDKTGSNVREPQWDQKPHPWTPTNTWPNFKQTLSTLSIKTFYFGRDSSMTVSVFLEALRKKSNPSFNTSTPVITILNSQRNIPKTQSIFWTLKSPSKTIPWSQTCTVNPLILTTTSFLNQPTLGNAFKAYPTVNTSESGEFAPESKILTNTWRKWLSISSKEDTL